MRAVSWSPNASFASLTCVICTWYVSFVSSERPNVGVQIRKARLALGLSQVTLAVRVGYAERSIQAWEAGERTPRLDNLMALAEVLGQDVAFFYGSDDVELLGVDPNGEAAA